MSALLQHRRFLALTRRAPPGRSPSATAHGSRTFARLSQDGGAARLPGPHSRHGHPFRRSARSTTLIVHDGAFGQFVMPPANAVSVGDWAELQGRRPRRDRGPDRCAADLLRTSMPEHVRKLGRAAMPQERTIAYLGDADRPLRLRLRRSRRRHPAGLAVARIPSRGSCSPTWRSRTAWCAPPSGTSSPADLTRFIDARVQLRGNIGTIFGRTEQLRGVSLFAGRIEDMIVLEAAAGSVFPARRARSGTSTTIRRPAKSTAGFASAASSPRDVTGTPVAMSDFTTSATFRYIVNVLYVKDGTGGVRIETEQIRMRPARRRRRSRRLPGGDARASRSCRNARASRVVGNAPQPPTSTSPTTTCSRPITTPSSCG